MTKHHIYTKKSHLTLVVLTLLALKQQAQIVVNNNAIINVNGGTASSSSSYLVLNTSATNPIKTIGTTGGIMMETEFSVTKYNVGPNTAAVTVPYFSKNSGTGVQFPLGVTGISGGIGNGNIQFSSKITSGPFTSGFDNLLYMPTGVNNMNGYNPPPPFVTDNSLNAIDRFWII